ncbi:MAG: hypothetical protein FJ100_11070 [Deltaproteobacteria bacterium]|nr:hypothetical protein [Deltaproteobacteria bacterium]
MTRTLRRLALRILLPVFSVAVVVLALWLARERFAPPSTAGRTPPAAGSVVQVPLSAPPFDRRDALYVIATVRWGQTSAAGQAAADGTGVPVVWDGYATLDCGSMEGADPLALEMLAGPDGRPTAGDRLGPVIAADGGESRVYWRSTTRGDWDGVRLHLAACRPPRGIKPNATLRVVTARKTWQVRLEANLEAFVSVPVASGQVLDVHLATVKDVEALQRARVSAAPLMPEPFAPLAVESPPPAGGPPHM